MAVRVAGTEGNKPLREVNDRLIAKIRFKAI